MKAMAMWAALAGVLGMGCLGEESTPSHRLPLVDLEAAKDLWSPDGCADLQSSGLGVERVGVEGDASLVAWVAGEQALCVETDATLGFVNIGAHDLSLNEPQHYTSGTQSVLTDPEPEPDDQNGTSLSPCDPEPEPDAPPGAHVASLTLGR